MNRKSRGEMVLSLLFAFVGCAGIMVIRNQQTTALSNTGATDFRTLPMFAGSALALLSFINAGRLLVVEWSVGRKKGVQEQVETEPEKIHQTITRVRVISMFFLCLALALLMKRMSFAMLIFLFLLSAFTVLGQRQLWRNILVSMLGSGFVYLVFIVFLKLPL